MDVRAENRGRPHQKMRFPAVPVMGKNFLTQGRPGVRVRNVRGKFGPKSLCLCCFFFPEIYTPLPLPPEKCLLAKKTGEGGGWENFLPENCLRKVADVWKKDVWEFQAKSGSSGSCRLFSPSFPRENRSSKNVWENIWKSQTSFLQTSAAFWCLAAMGFLEAVTEVFGNCLAAMGSLETVWPRW